MIYRRFVICIAFILLFPVLNILSQNVEMITLQKEMGAKLEWDPILENGVLIKNGNRLLFKLNTPWLIFNYSEKISIQPIQRKNNSIILTNSTAKLVKDYLSHTPEKPISPRIACIIIDAGHGGKDPGAIAFHQINGKTTKIAEKDIVLKTSLLLYNKLKQRFPEKKIILTRSDDRYLTLEQRVEIANHNRIEENEIILFFSIHANASLNKSAKGFEVWYLPPSVRRDVIDPKDIKSQDKEVAYILNDILEEEYTTESIILGKNILDCMQAEVGYLTKNRGLKEEAWFVVRNAKMPSILIELGFITNSEEAKNLVDNFYLQKMVNALYTGICDFSAQFEKKQ